MLTMTAKEQAVFEGAARRGTTHYIQVDVEDSNGTMQTWSNLGGVDFTGALSMSKNIQEGYWQGDLAFEWHRYNDNLSPFGLPAGRYHDYARPFRKIIISVKVVPQGADPSGYAWQKILDGVTTSLNIAQNPGSIGFMGRLMGNCQRNSFIDRIGRFGDTDGTKDVEDVMQDLLDAYYNPLETAPTLVFTATTFQVKTYNQQKMPLLQALTAIPQQIGWAIEERRQGDGEFALELYEPDRSQTVPDFEFQPKQVLSYGNYLLDFDSIRNQVEVVYGSSSGKDEYDWPIRSSEYRCDATTPAHTRLQDAPTVTPGSSIDKYGPLYMGLIEGATSLIQTQAQAAALADAAIADLADPTLIASVELPFLFWPVELNDYYRFKADGIRSQADIDLAVQGATISIDAGGGGKTSLDCKGKPGLTKRMWLSQEGRPGANFPSNTDRVLAPEVDSFNIKGRGSYAILREPPQDWDYDQIIWHRSQDPDFTPSNATKQISGRATWIIPPDERGVAYYYKVQVRDAQGNISDGSTESAPMYQDPVVEQPDIIPLLSCGTFAAPALDGAIAIFANVTSGSANVLSDTRWCAPRNGHYQISVNLSASSTPSSADLYLQLYNVTAGSESFVGPLSFGGGFGTEFVINGAFVANESDCFEIRITGTGTVGSFNLDGCVSISAVTATVGITSRDAPDPSVSGPPVAWIPGALTSPFGGNRTWEALDGEPRGTKYVTGSQQWKGASGEGEVQRWYTTEGLFAAINAAYGDETDRSADADDSAFSAVAWDQETGEFFAAGHTRDDAATDYAFVTQWAADSASPAEVDEVVLSTLGTDEEIPTGLRVRSSDQKAVVATKRDAGTGRMFRVNLGGTGSTDETGSAVDDFLDLIVLDLEPVITLAVGVAAGDLYAYDFDDLTDQQWTVDITTTYSETFRPEEGGEIREAADGRSFYMACGGGWESATASDTLYKFSRSGSLLWSVDVSSRTTLTSVDGVGPIAVDESNGDVYVVVVQYNNRRPLWDIVHFDRNGSFRSGMRKTFGLDPQSAAENNFLSTPVLQWPPMRLHRHGSSLNAYFREGFALSYYASSIGSFIDPGQAQSVSFHELSLDGLAEGDTPEYLTMVETSNDPGGDLLFRQSTLANRATYRSSGGPLNLPSLEFDGTDYYTLVDDLSSFELGDQSVGSDGIGILALVAPTATGSPGAYPIVTLWSETFGEDYPLIEVGAGESAVVGGSKFDIGGGLDQVLLEQNTQAGSLARFYFDSEDVEITDQAVLVGMESGKPIFNNRLFSSESMTEPSQLMRYVDILRSYQFQTVALAADDPTHWYSPDTGNATAPPDEGDGTAVNATASGTPTLTEGKNVTTYATSHYDLDAGDGFVLADNADFDFTGANDRTWVFWFVFDAQPTGDVGIAQKMDAADGWALYWDHSALQFRLDLSWAAGVSTSSAVGPVQDAAPAALARVCVAFTMATSHVQVWQDGAPGAVQTSVGDASNTSSVRVGDMDANFPVAVSDFDGEFGDFGMFTSRLHPTSLWLLWKIGRTGYTPNLLSASFANNVRDFKLTLGRTTYSPAREFEGFLYKLWLINLNGVGSTALSQQLHTLMRTYLPSDNDAGSPGRTQKNDPRWATCSQSWVWCRFWEASGATFEGETSSVGPHYTVRNGTAANVAAYQQTAPDILGAGGTGVFDDFDAGYAVTLDDTTTIAFDLPVVGTATTGSLIHLRDAWSVSCFFKWDTGSVHTRGHIWSVNLATGYIRVSIATNNIRVEWFDGTTTVTSDFTPEQDPLDGEWQALDIRFSSGISGALMDIGCRHSGGGWYAALPTDVGALDPTDYTALSADDEVVFGAGTNVTVGEEFEGDLAQVCISFGGHSLLNKW